MPQSSGNRNNNLLQTSPNMTPVQLKKASSDQVPKRVSSSHKAPTMGNTGTSNRLYNTQKYNRSGSKSENEKSSVRSQSN